MLPVLNAQESLEKLFNGRVGWMTGSKLNSSKT